MPNELLKLIAPTSFLVDFDGLGQLTCKSCKIPQKKPKLAGGDAPVSSGQGGKFMRQINSVGFEGLFTFDIVCICSASPSSTSKKLRDWFQKCLPSSEGGGGAWAANKESGSVYAYNIDNEVIQQWDFKEAFCSKYSMGELNVESKDYLEETYTMICEYWEQVPV